MFRVLVVTLFAAFCLAATPIYESKHYKVYSLKNLETSQLPTTKGKREFQTINAGKSRTITETPIVNTTIPEDDGSALFGDIWFFTTRKDGELLVRDTIVNQITTQDVYIHYNRSLPGYYVEDMILFNVGRQRGFSYRAVLIHELGYAEAELLVAANNTVRIFAEIYVRAEN